MFYIKIIVPKLKIILLFNNHLIYVSMVKVFKKKIIIKLHRNKFNLKVQTVLTLNLLLKWIIIVFQVIKKIAKKIFKYHKDKNPLKILIFLKKFISTLINEILA